MIIKLTQMIIENICHQKPNTTKYLPVDSQWDIDYVNTKKSFLTQKNL